MFRSEDNRDLLKTIEELKVLYLEALGTIDQLLGAKNDADRLLQEARAYLDSLVADK